MRRTIGGSAASLALTCATPWAAAQWSATVLHPPGSYYSVVAGVSATQQFGLWAPTTQSGSYPVIWSSGGLINLGPGTGNGGSLQCGTDNIQGGDYRGRAAIWYATPESRVDLDPGGTIISFVRGVCAQEQVGTRGSRAALWRGSPGSLVDLHPSWAYNSCAYGTDGVHQGGFTQTMGGPPYAALWSGNATSVVNINPAGALASTVRAVAPGQQVGWASFPFQTF